MLDYRTGLDLGEIPKAESPQVYIYIMENSAGLLKIGQTTNIKKRYLSLSGSNAHGDAITRVYCSPATYLKTMERGLHDRYSHFRIKGTEWFKDLGFEEVVGDLELLFSSDSYNTANELRRKRNDWIRGI